MTSKTLQQSTHQHLSSLRNKLLRLHLVLLEMERTTYEQVHGRVTGGELLQLVIHHEQFAWLHRISELVVRIDEMLHADEPLLPDDVQKLIAYTRTLLTPSETGNVFESKYYNALQHEPTAVLAHVEVSKLLTSDVQDSSK